LIRTLALFLSILSAVTVANGSSISAVTTRASLNANSTVVWSDFGPDGTDVVSGSTIAASDGLIVTVSQPFYGLQIRQQGTDWYGDFAVGDALLTNWNSPFSVTLTFSQPIYGAGLQIEPGQVQDLPAPFTAYVTAFDGSTSLGTFSVTGTKSNAGDDSAPFLGVLSDSPDVTSMTYRVVVQTNGPYTGDLGMNFMSIQSASTVPEPSSLLMLGIGAFAGIGTIRKWRLLA